MRNSIGIALIAAFGLSSAALAMHPNADPNLGTAVHEGTAARTIEVDPGTRWVNVERWETVRFVVKSADGKSQTFMWHFDTFGHPVFDLSRIAPEGALAGGRVQVYVGRNPRTDGSA